MVSGAGINICDSLINKTSFKDVINFTQKFHALYFIQIKRIVLRLKVSEYKTKLTIETVLGKL